MGSISSTIEMKKRKLAQELRSPSPRRHIIKRLENSIDRHKREMRSRNKGKSRRRKGIARMKRRNRTRSNKPHKGRIGWTG